MLEVCSFFFFSCCGPFHPTEAATVNRHLLNSMKLWTARNKTARWWPWNPRVSKSTWQSGCFLSFCLTHISRVHLSGRQTNGARLYLAYIYVRTHTYVGENGSCRLFARSQLLSLSLTEKKSVLTLRTRPTQFCFQKMGTTEKLKEERKFANRS